MVVDSHGRAPSLRKTSLLLETDRLRSWLISG